MAEDSDLERTEPASARRLEQAREEGQVPQSRELGAFLILMAAAASFWFMGQWLVRNLAGLMSHSLSLDAKQMWEPEQMVLRLGHVGGEAYLSMAPLLLLLLIAAATPAFLLNSFVFSAKALEPKFSRMNPLSGIKRIFSISGVVEMLKAVFKAGLIGGVAAWVIWRERDELIGLLALPLDAALASAAHLMVFSFLAVVSTMILIAGIDVPFQLWQYHDKLKMTREEVKQESKQMEGDPIVKGRIRALQRQAARRRMMSAVPQADVIVTNPTHFAVALAYKNGMGAPKVLAKGTGEVAQRIREIGAEHGVPLLEAPPLARALHRHVEIDDFIPAGLYASVAEVLAWVFQVSEWRAHGGQYPIPPRDVTVPSELAVAEVANG